MSPGRQLAVAFGEAPASLGRMSGRSWSWLGLYFALALGTLVALALVFASQEDTLKRTLVGFLFPEGWHGVVDFLLAFVLKAQAQQVLVNVLLFLSTSLVSIAFFWAKEALSRSYERDLARRRGEPDPVALWRDHPLWREALEEIKWTLVGLALMIVVLWLGHAPEPWRKTAATVASYAVLIFGTAGNFLAPPMQRRRLLYGQLVKAMFKRPLLAFGFGAAMALPQVVVLNVVATAELSALVALLVIFFVQIAFICWSAVAGTHAGLALLPTVEASAAPSWPTKIVGWAAVAAILGAGAWVGTKIGFALADKSQILKCRYQVDWSTVKIDTPQLGGLLQGKVGVGVSFEVAIDNPNPLPVRIENNRLVVADDDAVIAESHLAPLEVPAGGTTRARVGLDVEVHATSLLGGGHLDPRRWDVTLFVDLGDGLEMPVYLRAAP